MYLSTLITLAFAGTALSRAADKVCTSASSATLVWRITSFDYHSTETFTTPAHENAYGFANFTLENTALSYKTTCSAVSTQQPDYFYGNVVYNCARPADEKGDMSSFMFNRQDGLLKINQTWVCDRDGSHFMGQGDVKLDLKCKEDKWENPNWKMGEDYSRRNVVCGKVDVPVNITYLQGAA